MSTEFDQPAFDRLEGLLSTHGFIILRVKNHHKTSHPGAYKDVQIVIWSTCDATCVEIQLHTPATKDTSGRVHMYYSILKDPSEATWDKVKVIALLETRMEYSIQEPSLVQIQERRENLLRHVGS